LVENARSFAKIADDTLAWGIQHSDQFTGHVSRAKEVKPTPTHCEQQRQTRRVSASLAIGALPLAAMS
jgi:hypothetical protein